MKKGVLLRHASCAEQAPHVEVMLRALSADGAPVSPAVIADRLGIRVGDVSAALHFLAGRGSPEGFTPGPLDLPEGWVWVD